MYVVDSKQRGLLYNLQGKEDCIKAYSPKVVKEFTGFVAELSCAKPAQRSTVHKKCSNLPFEKNS